MNQATKFYVLKSWTSKVVSFFYFSCFSMCHFIKSGLFQKQIGNRGVFLVLCMYLMVIIDNSSLFCLYIFVLEDLAFFTTVFRVPGVLLWLMLRLCLEAFWISEWHQSGFIIPQAHLTAPVNKFQGQRKVLNWRVQISDLTFQ